MLCRCGDVEEFLGEEAAEYADKHLRRVRTDPSGWESEYVCQVTGHRWIKDYPQSEAHGGGWARLRRMTNEASGSS
jgi:hypothetical protein